MALASGKFVINDHSHCMCKSSLDSGLAIYMAPPQKGRWGQGHVPQMPHAGFVIILHSGCIYEQWMLKNKPQKH